MIERRNGLTNSFSKNLVLLSRERKFSSLPTSFLRRNTLTMMGFTSMIMETSVSFRAFSRLFSWPCRRRPPFHWNGAHQIPWWQISAVNYHPVQNSLFQGHKLYEKMPNITMQKSCNSCVCYTSISNLKFILSIILIECKGEERQQGPKS